MGRVNAFFILRAFKASQAEYSARFVIFFTISSPKMAQSVDTNTMYGECKMKTRMYEKKIPNVK